MTFTQTITETFHVVGCYTCGCNFGINGEMYRRAVKDKIGSVYCPACGKSTAWTGKTEAEKIRDSMQRKLDVANRRADNMENQADQAKKSLTATKGVVTRLKNRASKGICPCCNRHFANLQKHMESQHPDFTQPESD